MQESDADTVADVESQTDLLPEAKPQEIEKVVIKEVRVEPAAAPSTDAKSAGFSQSARGYAALIETTEFQTRGGVSVDERKLAEIPDLHALVMPLMASGAKVKVRIEPKTINVASAMLAGHHRPLLWTIQLMHKFLIDPILTSVDGLSGQTAEKIIVDWIEREFKIHHLATQAIMNISLAIMEHRTEYPMIELFADIVDSRFTLSQVCFISILYSNSVALTSPDLSDLMARMDIDPHDLDVEIHIKAAHAVLSKCLSNDLSGQFLGPRMSEEDPRLNYFNFVRNAAKFFGESHKIVFTQAKNLLLLCGSTDYQIILYEVFENFMVFLGNDPNIRDDWKTILERSPMKGSLIKFPELLTACADRKDVLMELFSLVPLKHIPKTMRKFSPQIREFHRELVSRFAKIVTQILTKWPAVPEKIAEIRQRLRNSFLTVDLPSAVWNYRLFVIQIDKMIMRKKGFIPFDPGASEGVIAQLREYINRTEACAFEVMDNSAEFVDKLRG